MSSRKTEKGIEKLYAASEEWRYRALLNDDSLFTPGKPIWSKELLGELRQCYLDNSDTSDLTFYEKLEGQLAGKSPEVHQLMAEVLYVHFLSQDHMNKDTKLGRIKEIFELPALSKQQIKISDDLRDALSHGIAQMDNRLLPFTVGFVIEFTDQWKGLEPADRQRLLHAPWEFKRFITQLNLLGKLFEEDSTGGYRLQQQVLLHLVHPDTFEDVASFKKKEEIANAKDFVRFVPVDVQDVDRKLGLIRRGLEAEYGKDFGFYDWIIQPLWDHDSRSNRWDVYLSQAKAYLDKGTLEKDEINYKHEIGRKLADARQAVLDGNDDWSDLVKRGISGNIIHFTVQDNFRNWIDENPNDARQALQVLWTRDNSSIEQRIANFCSKFPTSMVRGSGTRMTIVSQLLMGLDVKQHPPFRIRKFKNAYDRTGFKKPDKDADEATLYTHALRFLDQLITEAKRREVTITNPLEAQSVLWQISGIQDDDDEESETNDPIQPEPPEIDLEALAEELYLTPKFLEKINELLDDKKQVIFQGPPGTGKTYVARELAYHLSGSQDRVTFVQFHPSYDYEDFIQGYRPVPSNGQPGFKLTNGPLLEAANRAREDEARNVKHFLVIDEINRGNLAKVFGELYFLLEYRDQAINLQYQQEDEGTFSLPSNLYIIGTMNTADRSIALVDLALRRRFYFVEFHPDDEPVKDVLREWLKKNAANMKYVADCVDKANELLKDNRHAAIGPSYFMKDDLDRKTFERIWEHSVLPYIEELLFGQANQLGKFDLDKLCDKPPGPNGA